MSLDWEWMYRRLANDNLTHGFLEGVEIFVIFASTQPDHMDGTKIKCSCTKCKNTTLWLLSFISWRMGSSWGITSGACTERSWRWQHGRVQSLRENIIDMREWWWMLRIIIFNQGHSMLRSHQIPWPNTCTTCWRLPIESYGHGVKIIPNSLL